MRIFFQHERIITLAVLCVVFVGRPTDADEGCLTTGCLECTLTVDDTCPPAKQGAPPVLPIPPPPEPPAEDDRTFVSYFGGLAEDCVPAEGGSASITANVRVTRYVGETGSDGFLLDWQELLQKGVLGSHARLTIAAWDVDVKGSECGGSEVDLVYFNYSRVRSKPLGRLHGYNRGWSMTSFEIPVAWVKFPKKGDGDHGPTGGRNRIKIRVDAKDECWCTHIGWVSLEIQTMSPVVLLHGHGGDETFWKKPVITYTKGLDAWRIPWDNHSTHTSPRIDVSAGLINEEIAKIRRAWGVDSLHLVAHSKGGLDALSLLTGEYLLQSAGHRYTILSLTTLSSPLRGSVLADIITNRQKTMWHVLIGFPADFWGSLVTLFGANLLDDDWSDLTTYNVAARMDEWLPILRDERFADMLFATAGADMDRNKNKRVDGSEAQSLADYIDLSWWIEAAIGAFFGDYDEAVTWVANQLYQDLAQVRGVYTERGLLGELRIIAVPSSLHQGNDVLVTIDSALGNEDYRSLVFHAERMEGRLARTHANIAEESIARSWRPFWVMTELGPDGDLYPLPSRTGVIKK